MKIIIIIKIIQLNLFLNFIVIINIVNGCLICSSVIYYSERYASRKKRDEFKSTVNLFKQFPPLLGNQRTILKYVLLKLHFPTIIMIT